jgi:hypothetical protein
VRGLVGLLVEHPVGGQRRGEGVAAVVVAVGELGAGVPRQAHDDAGQGHDFNRLLVTGGVSH